MGILNRLKIGPKIILGYVVAGLAMVILTYVLLNNLSGLSDKFSFLVHHDTPVLVNAQELTGAMVNMETGLRGYLVTGDEQFLEPYDAGKAAFEELMVEEQELTSDNPAAVATLKAIHVLEQEWLHGYAEQAIDLRAEVEEGAVAQQNFKEISARTVGKEKFDAIRALLAGITAQFEAADDLEGRFLLQAITLDLVNMETGQRGFLLTGDDDSLDPFTQGQIALTTDVRKLKSHNYRAAGVSEADIDGIQLAVTAWKDAAAEPEIDARIEVRNFPKEMGDVIALVESGLGKQSMDVIRADLGEFIEAEVALNELRVADVEASTSSARTMGIGLAAVSIAVMMAIGFFLSRSISKGVATVSSALQRIAVGDLNANVNIKSADEVGDMAKAYAEMQGYLKEASQVAERIGDGDLTVAVKPRSEQDTLGNAFAQMVNNLRGLIGQVSSTATTMAEASNQLNNAAAQAGQATQGIASTTQQVAQGSEDQLQGIQNTTNAMTELTLAIDQIAQGSQQQSSAVEQTSSIVNQVSHAMTEVAQNVQAATEGARQTSEAARGGMELVEKTVIGMEKIKGAMDTASGKIVELGEQSAEIGKIVTVIDDIAAQTNLLALNAAIEAARAGEQGRGFAVVADEVRKLAERVTEATKEIANLIDNVQKGVTESIKATEDGTNEVSEGAQLTEEAGKALKQIMESVESVAQQIEQISAAAEEVSASSDEMVTTIDRVSSMVEQNSAASEQMAANSTEVSKAVEGVASITQENSSATQHVSAAAEEMSAQVQEVVASSQTLSQMARDLQEVASTFTIDGTGKDGGASRESVKPAPVAEAA